MKKGDSAAKPGGQKVSLHRLITVPNVLVTLPSSVRSIEFWVRVTPVAPTLVASSFAPSPNHTATAGGKQV